MKIILLCIALFPQLLSFAQPSDRNSTYYEISSERFRIRKVGDSLWMDSITFPNTIHQILYTKQQIPNPYFGNNEKSLKWMEETDWEIEGPLDSWKETGIVSNEIIFNRLEPFTEVYINDVFLFESKSSFIPYQFEILPFLKEEDNRIRFICKSPVKEAKKLERKNDLSLPGEERVYVRKPQFEFGWDWGPRLVTSGITDRITLVFHREKFVEFRDVYVSTELLDEKSAVLKCHVDIYSDIGQTKYFEIKYGKYNPKHIFRKKLKLKKGVNHFETEIKIENPKLWWPNGMGEPHLYRLTFLLDDTKNKKSRYYDAEYEMQYAICKLKLIQEKDSYGKSFYFEVNGKPVYLKGFNVIPAYHIDLVDYYNSDDKMLDLIAKTGNCNAVRIWGGGNYLKDHEISYLQERGILVWQDFMFAGGMYPGDSSFLKNVEEEITYQVKRLRNYNNIALYCGNNEVDEAWHNWGWQKQYNYSKEDSAKIWNDYQKLFQDLIPSIVKKYDQDTDYISSSPETGWGRKESMTQGDSHYWGVWWGKEPIETFEEKIPRFMSEFGMQAMPDLSTLRKVIPDSLMNFDSPEFKNHQKHPTGFETLNHYLEKYLTVPNDMGDYAYATQLLQAITLEKAIKAQRMSEKCMGTLIWQLNDTWPVTSWSVIDSEGNKKMAYDKIQESFDNNTLLLTSDSINFILEAQHHPNYQLWVKNEKENGYVDNNAGMNIRLSVKHLNGKTILDTNLIFDFKANGNHLTQLIPQKIIKDAEISDCYFIFNKINGYLTYTAYPLQLKEMDWKKPEYEIECNDLSMTYSNGLKPEMGYQCTITPVTDMHLVTFIDRDIKLPETLLAGQTYSFHIPPSGLKNEQDVINYVKKNLKSINHLLGK